MSSTVWLKFKNSIDNSERVLQDDYVHLTRVITALAKDCRTAGVKDLNDFVNYDEASSSFIEDIPESERPESFVCKKITDLIVTLTALECHKLPDVANDLKTMKENCLKNVGAFDVVELTYIM
jgi:hypothetical protein